MFRMSRWLFLACWTALFVVSSSLASIAPIASAGNWAEGSSAKPGAGHVAPKSIRASGDVQYFMFIDSSDTTASDSSYIFVPKGFRVTFWLDENLAQKAHDRSNLVNVQILVVPNSADGTPPKSDLNSMHLLGVTLDGVASTSSKTNDAIFDFEGPGYVKADITQAPGDQHALLIMQVVDHPVEHECSKR